MFPRTLGSVLMVIGGIWAIQGYGLMETGSPMDEQPLWAVLGTIAFVAGLGLVFLQRRAKNGVEPKP